MSLEENTNKERLLSRGEFLKSSWQDVLGLGKKALADTLPDMNQVDAIFKNPIAVIEVTECTAFTGSGCKTCYDVCPIQDVAIEVIENLPHIISAGCTGCGICIPACPTSKAIELK